MQVTVTGKQIDVGASLRGHVEAAPVAVVDKYFGRAIEAHVVFSRERHIFVSDISVHAGRGLLVQCQGRSEDAYAAFDGAADRLEKQLRRYKPRLGRSRSRRPEPPRQDGQGFVMDIADLLTPAGVIANLRAANKRQALQELAKRAAAVTGQHERAIFDVLLERERLGTNGLGSGTR